MQAPPRRKRPRVCIVRQTDLYEPPVQREAEALAGARTGRSGARLRELARNLRALRGCYLETRAPRLRAALLREAGELMRRLRRFGAERS